MKIVSSNLAMNASHVYQESYQSKSTLLTRKIAVSDRLLDTTSNDLAKVGNSDTNLRETDKYKLELIKCLFKLLTGQDMVLLDVDASTKLLEGNGSKYMQSMDVQEQFFAFYETYTESERMDFSVKGEIVCGQGQHFNIDMSISMSREFMAENYVLLKEEKPIDPLVINFLAKAAELSTQNTDFDLNGDGQLEKIYFVETGSGFLVLDKNADNKVNDGSELFGPLDGDGFKALATYDIDNNGWIDENDTVFNQLKIWTQDRRNNKQLFSLKEVGVGAISLSQIDTPYTYKNWLNQPLGQLTSTGIALRNTGEVISVQQVNLFI